MVSTSKRVRELVASSGMSEEMFPYEGLSLEDAKVIQELAEQLLPFAPMPAPSLPRELVGLAA